MDGSAMEDEPSGAGSSSQQQEGRRWTCEACGCNTNVATDRSCSVCGTSASSGSSLLRRAGYAARAGLFARSVAARRSFVNDEIGMDGYEFWGRAMEGDVDMDGEEDEHAIAALAMEVAGAGGGRAGGDRDGGPRSIVDAARSFALAASNREPERLEPEELLHAARENGSLYQPKWMNPSQIGGRMRTGNGIEVGDGENQNVAYLPLGVGEGRALRALEAFPRSAPFASFSLASSSSSSNNRSGQERRPRRVFGFRVAFDHPTKAEGRNMGGSYLIGVTTTSFAAFSERNALQQSPFFWGIEDSGNKYEGSRHHAAREAHRRGLPSYAVELGDGVAPRNEDNVLFGSRQVITCVVDLEGRTLTFWREEGGENKLLGTLVSNIPRSGQLYPIVVPYNAGSTVAITGMSANPLPLLTSFATDWKQAQLEKDALRRKDLQADRLVLVQNGSVTPALFAVLQEIFSYYCANGDNRLNRIEASRLWYRCGLTLSSLENVFDNKSKCTGTDPNYVVFNDFYDLIHSVLVEDSKYLQTDTTCNGDYAASFEVGEKVELVEGYERFGDATNGPLLPGERGTIVELQKGPSGERHSIRVLYNSRRWWYQPQALIGEKSGLTDSPGVWFLKRVLRSHGYDYRTLRLLVGNQVSTSSWQVGDLVVPKKLPRENCNEKAEHGIDEAVGRIISESSTSGSSATRSRVTGSVMVEFVSGTFAEGASIQVGASLKEKSFSLESRRVPTSRLVHTSAFHGIDAAQKPRAASLAARSRKHGRGESKSMDLDDISSTHSGDFADDHSIDGSVLSDLQGMKYLDATAIERIIKECDKTSTSLNSLFEAKLPTIALQALDCVQKNIHLAGSDESLAHALSNLGRLSLLVAERSFPEECPEDPTSTEERSQPRPSDVESNDPRSSQEEPRPGANDENTNRSLSDPGRLNRATSLQQRRRMLLSLMSRARRGDVSSLGDLLNRDMDGMPPIEISADAAAALFFGSSPGDISGFEVANEDHDNDRMENSRPIESSLQSDENTTGKTNIEDTFLDKVLRARTSAFQPGEKCRIPAASIKSIVSMGILGDSLPWLKSLLDSLTDSLFKKVRGEKQNSRSMHLLKEAVDEDGMPLLSLAISLGCSEDIVSLLIRYGCPVGESEIKLAAKNDLAQILSKLLHYQVYHDGMIDLETCSPAVAAVVRDALERQKIQRSTLRKEAEAFLVSFFQKLLDICFCSRRYQQTQNENDLIGRAVSSALVGNVELCALRKRQKSVTSIESQMNEALGSGGGVISIAPRGLIQTLPISILGKALLKPDDPSHLTTLLLLIEDFLCSKDVNNGGVGLTLLLTLLERFPSLNQSQEIERYGYAELVSSHDALAMNKLADISSRVAKRTTGGDASDEDILSATGVVLCPKKHTASLHVTKHASFRCDLCGKGVEKGAVMHGCRQCDWDACEACMDKQEGGIVKWKHVRALAAKCQELFHSSMDGNSMKEDNEWATRMVESLKPMDNTSDVNTLSIRLLQRDSDSVRTLSNMLGTRGKITFHQFLMVILPALHSSLTGKGSHRGGRYHRSKKPRQDEDRMHSSEDERLEFAREILKLLVNRSPKESDGMGLDDAESNHNSQDDHRLDCEEDDYEGSDDEYEERHEAKMAALQEKNKTKHVSGFLRRLHQILALHEDVFTLNVGQSGQKETVSPNELRSLKSPVKIQLAQSTQQKKQEAIIFVEPLVSVEDLSRQVMKTALKSHPQYIQFCQSLVDDSAIIIERAQAPTKGVERKWRIAKILSFDTRGGYHTITYASGFVGGFAGTQLHFQTEDDFSRLKFESKTTLLMLSAREYVIAHRAQNPQYLKTPFDMEDLLSDAMVGQDEEERDVNDSVSLGVRVESDFISSAWHCYTVVAVRQIDSSNRSRTYDLVSEDGEVIGGVPENRIRGLGSSDEINNSVDMEVSDVGSRADRRSAEARAHLSRAFPFLTARRQLSSSSSSNGSSQGKIFKRMLKRTWSALAPIEAMCPVGVNAESGKFLTSTSAAATLWKCQVGELEMAVSIRNDLVDFPPSISVEFSLARSPSPAKVAEPADTTLVALLRRLYESEEFDMFGKEGHQILYSVVLRPSKSPPRFDDMKLSQLEPTSFNTPLAAHDIIPSDQNNSLIDQSSRSRKLSDTGSYSDDDDIGVRLSCEGLDEICVQCLEIIEYLAEVDGRLEGGRKKNDDSDSIFVNKGLSQKLTEQLESPLFVVGKAIPEWCLVLPSFCPHLFSYDSRKLLLDRVAFGISRSTLKQQEAKVNVGRLRQRMTALRARAVELVGEAFSGGSEDPTALQLQADELYGMEEALGARIRSSFRAEGWEETALQVAKAVVHRDLLIADAMSIMEQYATDPLLNRRRLEVRFEGESGFDAASGDEAGVTRGFYADVAENLLNCEYVAGVSFSLTCATGLNTPSAMNSITFKAHGEPCSKLPLWIPDIDSSGQVIIPTPRAAASSLIGIFPRPIGKLHPQFLEVLNAFRFMGRLFAAALRDGFMFPLPLSASFLKLVQHGNTAGNIDTDAVRGGNILSSSDLPRPGFLGGEVYAVEMHICRALDQIDQADPPLSEAELEREYCRIASDKSFAREALGKSYDCSFDDYFQDRTFVDPLDPTQGIEAHPLCQNGHNKSVTIHNIREWVALAKDFMLHDGVIGQAVAFRAGVGDFFSSDYLRLFTAEELQSDVCGVGDNVDNWNEGDIRKLFKLDGKGATEALVAVAAIGGNAEALSRRFGPSSPTIKFVIKALLEASPKQRRMFLSFVTSVPIVTPGQIEVVPVVSSSGEFLPMRDPGCLPRANTCARRLYLPKFETYQSFKQVLWAVVEEEFKHKGFFEWSL